MPVNRVTHLLAGAALFFAACTGSETATADPTPTATEVPDVSAPESESADPALPPGPFVPTGPVGNAASYDELIRELEVEIPAALRNDVPWPDLRNPDPVQAQLDIFDLWIWMSATHPEPALAPAMAAPDSPSRSQIAGLFGELKASDELHAREQQPYRAYDHRVVTFESAGLPLWLARDVPDDAVVVYYKDDSGPTTVRDRNTNAILGIDPGVSTRQWVSIMVPTDVGWLLFRDQLIEPGNSELPVPDAPPSGSTDVRKDV